jgi:hypothetical protein
VFDNVLYGFKLTALAVVVVFGDLSLLKVCTNVSMMTFLYSLDDEKGVVRGKIFRCSHMTLFVLADGGQGSYVLPIDVIVGVSDVPLVSDKGVPVQMISYLISC